MDNNFSWNEIVVNLRQELECLAQFVETTKKGFDNFENTVKASSEKFPEASNQLNAVTGDLENAANTIMNILEGLLSEQDNASALLADLSQWAGSLEPAASAVGLEKIQKLDAISNKTKSDMMDMFAHMSFHDLSGQKLKKVIATLAVVERKLLDLALNFGAKDGEAKLAGIKDDSELLGASNPNPIDQDLVDKLLKELGT